MIRKAVTDKHGGIACWTEVCNDDSPGKPEHPSGITLAYDCEWVQYNCKHWI